MVCNVPDYGTTEVADHTIALVLALRRGLIQHHETQRKPNPGWRHSDSPLGQRMSAQRFGIIGLGRIGSAAALPAKAFRCRRTASDTYQPNPVELPLRIDRAPTLDEIL